MLLEGSWLLKKKYKNASFFELQYFKPSYIHLSPWHTSSLLKGSVCNVSLFLRLLANSKMWLNHVATVSLLANSWKWRRETVKFYSPKMRVDHRNWHSRVWIGSCWPVPFHLWDLLVRFKLGMLILNCCEIARFSWVSSSKTLHWGGIHKRLGRRWLDLS